MNNVTFARTALIVLVVLGHSLAPWTGDWGYTEAVIDAPILGYISQWISTYHTITLTAISGFTYEYIVDKRGGYLFNELLKKKTKRLLIPYFLVSVLWVIPLTSYFADITPDFVINKFVLGKAPSQLWYLIMLFDVFVMFFPLRLLINKSKWFYLLPPMLYVLGSLIGDQTNNYYQFFSALRFLSFFAIGHLVYQYKEKLFSIKRISLGNPQVLITLLLIHVFVFILYLQDIPKTKTLLMLYMNFAGCLTIMAALFYIGERINQQGKFMSMLNDNSFAIYLFHQQIIYYSLFFLNGLMNPVLHAFVNFVVSLALSLVFILVFRKVGFLRIYMLGEKK